jgi:hypothetical protein
VRWLASHCGAPILTLAATLRAIISWKDF